MANKFLSEAWFSKLAELKGAAGDIEVPPMMADLVINITAQEDGAENQLCFKQGMLEQGHDDSSTVGITLPADLVFKIFIELDQSAGMAGFMEGKIQVDGDMSKLMALQTVQPSDSQMALQKQILEVTEV